MSQTIPKYPKKEVEIMLNKKVSYRTSLKSGKILVPELYRWQYKIESSQVLNASINLTVDWSNKESFLTKIRKDGYITIPKATQYRLKPNLNLKDCSIDVTVEPT